MAYETKDQLRDRASWVERDMDNGVTHYQVDGFKVYGLPADIISPPPKFTVEASDLLEQLKTGVKFWGMFKENRNVVHIYDAVPLSLQVKSKRWNGCALNIQTRDDDKSDWVVLLIGDGNAFNGFKKSWYGRMGNISTVGIDHIHTPDNTGYLLPGTRWYLAGYGDEWFQLRQVWTSIDNPHSRYEVSVRDDSRTVNGEFNLLPHIPNWGWHTEKKGD